MPNGMKLSLFRTKSSQSGTPSPRKTSRFSQILSPTRSNTDASESQSSPILSRQSGKDADANPESAESNAEHDAPAPEQEPIPSDGPASEGISHAPDSSSQVGLSSDALDEQEMVRKLDDLESSFVPDVLLQPAPPVRQSSLGRASNADRSSAQRPHSQSGRRDISNSTVVRADGYISSSRGPLDSPDAYFGLGKTRYPFKQDTNDGSDTELNSRSVSQNAFSGPNVFSSPTAAATERYQQRASAANQSSQGFVSGGEESEEKEDDIDASSIRPNPRRSHASMRLEVPQLSADDSSTTDLKRPSYLQDRQASQRSSASSNAPTVGGDTPHRSKGSLSTVRPSRELSRLPSLGSVASSVSTGSDGNGIYNRKRSTSVPFRSSRNKKSQTGDEAHDRLLGDLDTTPRPQQRALDDLSNTALTQHVREVKVPDTVAREYRSSHAASNPEGRSQMSTPHFSRAKNTLTLKEQNQRIDKLSKENFDLKLKIHYLHQALQNRSDEGIADLVSKNTQLQAELVKAKKDNQQLRKKLRQIEKQKLGTPSLTGTHSVAYEESDGGYSTRSQLHAQLEEEIIYLRDRVQELEHENGNLARGRPSPKGALQPQMAGSPTKEVFDQEIARRERAENEVTRLREELQQLRSDRWPLERLRPKNSEANLSEPEKDMVRSQVSATSSEAREINSLSGSTLVEYLKQENADLRRDLGAQTSMLTSRNRERERLQQEIEDLKLAHRRGKGPESTAGDSILDRSVSRNQQRPVSRASASARSSNTGDSDRDKWENIQASLRDENAVLKMRVQDLQRELNKYNDDSELLETLQAQREEVAQALKEAEVDAEYLTTAIAELEDIVEAKDREIITLSEEKRKKEEESYMLEGEIKSINDSLNRLVEDSENNQSLIQSLQEDLTNANGEIEGLEETLREANSEKERLEVQAESHQGEIAFLREEQEGDKIKIGDLQSLLREARKDLKGGKERLERLEDLETQLSKTKEELRRAQKSLSAKENESATASQQLQDAERDLRDALDRPDAKLAELLKQAVRMRRELQKTVKELDNVDVQLAEKDRIIKDREALLESSGLETTRLADQLQKEKQARKHDQNEFERMRRRANPSAAEYEAKIAGHESKIADLERRHAESIENTKELESDYTARLDARNDVLFSIWERLANLCSANWAAKHDLLDQDGNAPTRSTHTEKQAAFDQNLVVQIETVEQAVQTFKSRLRATEKDIWKDFQTLEHALDNRIKRLDYVEKLYSQRRMLEKSTAQDHARLKEENKLLRRELKFLKQGSFALPGLPSPHGEVDRAAAAVAAARSQRPPSPSALLQHTNSTGAVPRSKRHSSSNGRSALLRHHSSGADNLTRSTSGYSPSEDTMNPTAAVSTEPLEAHSQEAAIEDEQEPPGNRETSLTAPKHAPEMTASTANSEFTHEASVGNYTDATSGATSDRYLHAPASTLLPSLPPNEERWNMRLQELKRRLDLEREARLLDRAGARKRLQEGIEERDALKGALQRQRTRSKIKGQRSRTEDEDRQTGGGRNQVDPSTADEDGGVD